MDQQLLEAVEKSSLASVQAALQAGADPNARKGKQTALDLVPHRRDDIRCALIEAGAWNDSLRGSLVWAVSTRRLQTVQALIDRGADVNVSTHSGTPLHNAAALAETEIVRRLLAAGADPDAGGGFDVPLTAAVRVGSAEIVHMLLTARANPDARAEYVDATALAIAAVQGNAAMVEELLAAGAEVDRRCSNVGVKRGEVLGAPESTPLVLAARYNHGQCIKRLLAAGADPHVRDGEGQSAFDRARQPGNEAALQAMQSAGVTDVVRSPDELLVLAAEDAHEVTRLLAAGASTEGRDERKATRGFTPLMLAAASGNAESVRRLLAAGADVNAIEPGEPKKVKQLARFADEDGVVASGFTLGRPPLMLAIQGGHQEAATALVEAGASVAAADFLGVTPLQLAAREGQEGMARRLLEAGADVLAKGAGGQTPLQEAVSSGHSAVATMLLEKARTLKKKVPGANAMLRDAASHCDPVLVRKLLEAGADPRSSTKDGAPVETAVGACRWVVTGIGSKTMTPCSEDEVLEVVRLLLEAGADVEAPGIGGTPLMKAARDGRRRLVELLLAAGADPKREHGEQTALDCARFQHQNEIESLLLQHGASAGSPTKEAPTREPQGASLPSFGDAASSTAYLQAVQDLADRCGSEAVPMHVEGAFSLHVQVNRRGGPSTEALQKEFLPRGCFVFEPSYAHGKGPERLAVIPTPDPMQAIALMQTNGANYDLGPGDVIAWMQALQAEHPYVLTTVASDTLAGRFLAPLDDPDAMAERMYEFCPDIVDQGCETVEVLAETLRRSPSLFFWWD